MRHQRRRKAGVARRLSELAAGLLRTRQVYVRSRSDVHYVTLGPMSQLALLTLCLCGLLWSAYASVNILFKDQLLELKQQKLFEARLDYEDQLAKLRAEIEKASDRLLINQQAYLKKVDKVKEEFDALADQQGMIETYFRQGWFPLKPSPASPQAKPQQDSQLDLFRKRYSAEFRSDGDVLRPLADLRAMMAEVHHRHLETLRGGIEYADRRLARATGLLARLGLKPTPAPADAMGGPFVPSSKADAASQSEADTQDALARLQAKVGEDKRVRAEVARLPLGLPLAQIERISSEFGTRSDPLRGAMAMHGAIDFVAPYGAPVMATSPGKVVWSGPHGPYGNMVEILHDNGVSTRYGHLKGTSATFGQRINKGDVIGWLGNTGRSTGPHLHYETRINDRATDPRNFWRIQDDLQTLETDD
jgi:murein DD-endopeptidase MepM/ murein hydrolase activator NlpD